jgi:hypothetical protein
MTNNFTYLYDGPMVKDLFLKHVDEAKGKVQTFILAP